MNKKVTSMLLVFVMVFSLLATAVPAMAAEATEVVLSVTPNKTEAYPGDTITYTVTLAPAVNFDCGEFKVVIPEGLTYKTNSYTLSEELEEVKYELSFTEKSMKFVYLYNPDSTVGRTTQDQIELMTFQCVVDADATVGESYVVTVDEDTYYFAGAYMDATDTLVYDTYEVKELKTAGVKITAQPISATGITLNKTTLALDEGASETLVATVAPSNSTDSVTWKSSDEKVATVDANGKVTAVAKGSATITATAGSVSATCAVTVNCAHNWVAATCTEPKTCDKCGATEGDALGHTWVAATCTEPKTCSVCQATEGDALGHTWTAATCTEPKTCSVCKATEGDALGHTWVAATCTEPKTCSVCKATEGEALGHNYSTEWSKDATNHWHECTNGCNEKKDEAVHDFGTGDKCEICGYERDHQHRLTLVPGTAAGCLTAGVKDYYACSGCDAKFADASGTVEITDLTIPATGHDYVDGKCANCGDVLEVAAGENDVTVSEIEGVEAEVVESVAEALADSNVTGAGLDAAVAEAAKNLDEDTTIQIALDVELQAIELAEDGTMAGLTLDISPVYQVLNAEGKVESEGELKITGAVTVSVSLPEGFAADGQTLYVRHTTDDGTVYTYEGTVSNNVLTFTNENGFSLFEISVNSFAPDEVPTTPVEPATPVWKDWLKGLLDKWFGEDEEPTEPAPTEPAPSEPEESVPATPVEPPVTNWKDWLKDLLSNLWPIW